MTKLRSIPEEGKRLLSCPKRPDRLRGATQPPIQGEMGNLSRDKAVGTQNFQ